MAQYQRSDGVAASQLQLRQGFAGRHLAYQLTQRQQHAADMRGQNGAHLHVGDVAAFALMKANQHFALFNHVAHRQARPITVAPSGPLDRSQQGFGFDFAQVPQVVFEHPLLHSHLGRGL